MEYLVVQKIDKGTDIRAGVYSILSESGRKVNVVINGKEREFEQPSQANRFYEHRQGNVLIARAVKADTEQLHKHMMSEGLESPDEGEENESLNN